MKRITAYFNTTRIHWLVEELQAKGINEIIVSEFFRPGCQISKFEFYCFENSIEKVKSIIHKVGTCGKPADHLIEVKDADGQSKSIFPFV